MQQLDLIIDVCSGSRMFWFQKNHPNVVYCDKRKHQEILCDGRILNIDPDILCDFRSLPFSDSSFSLVVFDPPHLLKAGKKSWLAAKYGKLSDSWQDDIKKGFEECFRVLKTHGTLVFKWNEDQIPVKKILELSPYPPLFGNISGRRSKSHWIVFMKMEGK